MLKCLRNSCRSYLLITTTIAILQNVSAVVCQIIRALLLPVRTAERAVQLAVATLVRAIHNSLGSTAKQVTTTITETVNDYMLVVSQ